MEQLLGRDVGSYKGFDYKLNGYGGYDIQG